MCDTEQGSVRKDFIMSVSNCNQCGQRLAHLFNAPLCKSQSLIRRIINIGFHIFTLGIPLAVYKLMSVCCPSFLGIKEVESRRSSLTSVVKTPKVVKPLSDLEMKAMRRAREILDSCNKDELKDLPYEEEVLNPISQDIIDYMKLLDKQRNHMFDVARDCDMDTTYQNQEFLKSANDLLSLGFTILIRMLEDVDLFVDVNRNILKDRLDAFTYQGGYMLTLFFNVMHDYNRIRSDFRYDPGIERFTWSNVLDPEKLKSFFQKGTMQNEWRLLRNAFCDRLRMYISNEELNSNLGQGPRCQYWSQKETNINECRSLRN